MQTSRGSYDVVSTFYKNVLNKLLNSRSTLIRAYSPKSEPSS